jgi:hypothetical protein
MVTEVGYRRIESIKGFFFFFFFHVRTSSYTYEFHWTQK